MKTKEFNGFIELDKSQLREIKGGWVEPPPPSEEFLWPGVDYFYYVWDNLTQSHVLRFMMW